MGKSPWFVGLFALVIPMTAQADIRNECFARLPYDGGRVVTYRRHDIKRKTELNYDSKPIFDHRPEIFRIDNCITRKKKI